MKILVLGFAKIKYMPYLNFYLDSISASENEVHVVYWDRDGKPDSPPKEEVLYHKFSYALSDFDNASKKIKAFNKYRRFAKQLIKSEKFDYIISLHTWPAVLLNKEITGKYQKRFIYDYRDMTVENNALLKKIIDRLIYAATVTFVSSKAFLKNLPTNGSYQISHNLTEDSFDHREKHSLKSASPIRVRFWGLFRSRETDLAFIKALGDDPRFELHFHGRDGEYIEKAIAHNAYTNVFMHGEYEPQDRFEFAKETELLINIPDNIDNSMLAVGNKTYDGAILYVPQICSDQQYMGKINERYGLGINVDPFSEDLADKLYNFIKGIDEEKFWSNCDEFAEGALKEYKIGQDVIRKQLNIE